MAVDPVVSPADTRTVLRAYAEQLPTVLSVPNLRTALREAADEIDALLAVGERDKARIAWLEGEERGWRTGTLAQTKRLGECEEARERDRRQIARLTEALERLESVQPRVLEMIERNGFVFRTPLGKPDDERTEAERWEKLAFTLYSELCETNSIARAVLADKEDAANGD